MSDLSSHFPLPASPAQLLPPTGPPMGGFPPPPPPRPRRSYTGWIIAAVVGGVLLLGAGGYGAVLLVTAAIDQLESTPEAEQYPEWAPLATGGPGSPLARDPLACPSACFTDADIAATVVGEDELDAVGLSEGQWSWGAYLDSAVGQEYNMFRLQWDDTLAEPAECFPLSITSPIAAPYDKRPLAPKDAIYFVGGANDVDELDYFSQATRVFGSSAEATSHMEALAQHVLNCQHYFSEGEDYYWSSDVTSAPALTVPPSVAAVGWQEEGNGGRFFSFDLQRGNMVVRSSLWIADEATESDFRTLMTGLAEQLESAPVPEG